MKKCCYNLKYRIFTFQKLSANSVSLDNIRRKIWLFIPYFGVNYGI